MLDLSLKSNRKYPILYQNFNDFNSIYGFYSHYALCELDVKFKNTPTDVFREACLTNSKELYLTRKPLPILSHNKKINNHKPNAPTYLQLVVPYNYNTFIHNLWSDYILLNDTEMTYPIIFNDKFDNDVVIDETYNNKYIKIRFICPYTPPKKIDRKKEYPLWINKCIKDDKLERFNVNVYENPNIYCRDYTTGIRNLNQSSSTLYINKNGLLKCTDPSLYNSGRRDMKIYKPDIIKIYEHKD